MDVRALGSVAGVLGGLCWVVPWVAEVGGSTPGWSGALHWAGLGLLAASLAVVGAGLVSSSAPWLRVLVGVAVPLLVWSLYSVLRGGAGALVLDGMIGVLAVGLGAVALATGRRTATSAARHGVDQGSHAAR